MYPQDIDKEIHSIPGNGKAIEELHKLFESGKAIALVGAGASAELWPLWNKFLQGFIEHSQKSGKISRAEADFFLNEEPKSPLEIMQLLRNKIGDSLYFEYIQETFCDKISQQTGGAFTRTHKALLQLPIHNYLTLNFDAGLTNARAVLYPKATTSYYFWDQEKARQIFDCNYQRQVLHAHGRYDRSDSIILTLDDYRKAYGCRTFVRLLESLFSYKNLLIVGFGMSDPYIKQLFNNISGDYKKSPLRHIAFVGLDDKDFQVTHLIRERVEMVYGSRIIFYPARNYHQALADWLTMLAKDYATVTGSQTAEEIQPQSTPPNQETELPDEYIHQPTDDAYFKGRVQDFATLNRWGNDPATRMIAITSIGGEGKTAIVGRWLRQERIPDLAWIPVFYWSFYEDLDVEKFFKQVVKFCLPIDPVYSSQEIEPISFILSVVRKARLLLVLDGLEVIQEEAISPAHGRINHPRLEEMLQQWLRYPHQGIVILTSRFRFPQFARYSGVGFHPLNLMRLSTQDGISLLEELGLRGKQQLMETYVEALHGHPLALRILASGVKRRCFGDLSQFEGGKVLTAVGQEGRLSQKLKHLLSFYESQLRHGQKELLWILSLFKRPVEIKSFVTLLDNMKSLEKTPLAKANTAEIVNQLDLLCDDFLIEKKAEGITTHPIIRDYFRKNNKIDGSRRDVADFLKARPGAEQPKDIEEVRDLVEAVELLCDEEEFNAAHDLRMSRLDKGGEEFNVFRDLPAAAEGVQCELAFIKDEARRQKIERIMGKSILAIHYSGAALNNYLLGNLSQALDWRKKCLEINRQLDIKSRQDIDLFALSLIEFAMGEIEQACESVSQSLRISYEIRDFEHLKIEFAFKAYYEFLRGHSIQAFKYFEFALYCDPERSSNQRFLHSIMGNQQAEFFIRLQAWEQFERANSLQTKSCESNRGLAFCRLLEGWHEICRGQLSRAEKTLLKADSIIRPSGMMEYICRIDWIWALLAEAKGEYQDGLNKVNDALLTCADKGFRLWQADLLVIRGRLHLLQFQKENYQDNDLLEKARDDAYETLNITEQTSYIWPKVDALELLAAFHQIRAGLPAFNLEDEKHLALSYARKVASIKTDVLLTKKQMRVLKAKARKEYEKQIAEWDKGM